MSGSPIILDVEGAFMMGKEFQEGKSADYVRSIREKMSQALNDESRGIDVRFHNGDFYLSDDEVELMTQYISAVAAEAEENGLFAVEDVKIIVRLIEVLSQSDEYSTLIPLQRIFRKIEQMKI